jgi:hypothetical protein
MERSRPSLDRSGWSVPPLARSDPSNVVFQRGDLGISDLGKLPALSGWCDGSLGSWTIASCHREPQ